MVATSLQLCYAVLRWKSSLRIVSCNITFRKLKISKQYLPSSPFSCDHHGQVLWKILVRFKKDNIFPKNIQRLSAELIYCVFKKIGCIGQPSFLPAFLSIFFSSGSSLAVFLSAFLCDFLSEFFLDFLSDYLPNSLFNFLSDYFCPISCRFFVRFSCSLSGSLSSSPVGNFSSGNTSSTFNFSEGFARSRQFRAISVLPSWILKREREKRM